MWRGGRRTDERVANLWDERFAQPDVPSVLLGLAKAGGTARAYFER